MSPPPAKKAATGQKPAASRKAPAATPAAVPTAPADLAKAALRRLAAARQEPTPENYAQAYAEEAGTPRTAAPLPARARGALERLVARQSDDARQRDELLQSLLKGQWDDAQQQLDKLGDAAIEASQAWAQLIDRLARALERGSRQWTAARKKESLQRVLESSGSDMQRLSTRLKQLIASWEGDVADNAADPDAAVAGDDAVTAAAPRSNIDTASSAVATSSAADTGEWPAVTDALQGAVQAALPAEDERAGALADEFGALADRLAQHGATRALAEEAAELCVRARRLFAHRHHLLEELHKLSRQLAGSLTELAEDDSWAAGQCAALNERLGEAPSVRAIRAASHLLASARVHQQALRGERDVARNALKDLISLMLSELSELDLHTGRFGDNLLRYADLVERADTLESLTGTVREMVDESRSVHTLVTGTRERLNTEHRRAGELETRVRELEDELRKLSDEVATDVLTQVANRRGMMQAFDVELARQNRNASELAVGLLDIDNFKRLNDTLGHAAGDQALVALAKHVRTSLRPIDAVARFGGEEFVVLLPDTPLDEAQQILTRLQRSLSAGLFMHEGKEVFVTFSAGVTLHRPGEAIEAALERADEALYEAKRTGKNRTCMA